MNQNIKHQLFSEINLSDKFFDSLKNDYPEFEVWFNKDLNRDAYVLYDEKKNIQGFLHLKKEVDVVDDVRPVIKAANILKVATFKVEAHGTKMGEQFIKLIADRAINEKVDLCYVTIFPKQKTLIKLLEKFGFEEYGEKGDTLEPEKVYVKSMKNIVGDINKDYPLIQKDGSDKYLLGIYPQYHSVMFPDSILKTEDPSMLEDISYTNSIHKIYVCTMDVDNLKYGDLVIVYRTGETGKLAEYSAVATSICVVEEIKSQREFRSFEEFYRYASQYSVFDRNDLYKWYRKGTCKAIKMTYNVAFKKRIVRHDLIQGIGIARNAYWGFIKLTDEQFEKITNYAEVNTQFFA